MSALAESTWRMPSWKHFAAGALLVAMTAAVYEPAARNQYIWDDESYIENNGNLSSLEGLRTIWINPQASPQYYPLVFTTFWVEYHIWGLEASGYHRVNVALHVISTVLLWLLLRRLTVPGAWFAAAVFAVHPLCVESVAWITERKNVLSLCLTLTSMLLYLRYAAPRTRFEAENRWTWYGLSLAAFVAALLSKTVVASMPAVLLVTFWWQRGRIRSTDVLPLLPFFAVGASMGIATAWLEVYHVGAIGEDFALSPAERILLAGRAVWFYAAHVFWPIHLMFFYPRWVLDPYAWWQYAFPVGAVGLLVVLWLLRHRIGRGPLAAALIFGGVLFPALGFLNVFPFRYSFVADHFEYQAMIALIALVVGAVATHVARRPVLRPAAMAAGAVLLGGLAFLTVRQIPIYENLETLYRDVIAKNPESWIAQHNLGTHLIRQERYEEAILQLREALRLKPDHAHAGTNLGIALGHTGKQEEAIREFESVLKFHPMHAGAHYNLAIVLSDLGRGDEAIQHFRRAWQYEPRDWKGPAMIGKIYHRKGDLARAEQFYKKAIDIDPSAVDARRLLVEIFEKQGRVPEASKQLLEIVNIERSSAQAHTQFGASLVALGELKTGEAAFHHALSLDPNHTVARRNLGAVLRLRGDIPASEVQLRRAAAEAPKDVMSHIDLGKTLDLAGKPDEAHQSYDRALAIDPKNPEAHNALAALFAKQGKYDEAETHFRAALESMPNHEAAAANLKQLLELRKTQPAPPTAQAPDAKP